LDFNKRILILKMHGANIKKIYIVEKPQTRCNGPKLGCHAILVVAVVVAAVIVIAAVTQ
jgi:hypothetical protein